MKLCILVTLCLAQVLSHPVSPDVDVLQQIKDELIGLEEETTVNLGTTLRKINELKQLLARLGETVGNSEEEQIDVLVDERMSEETNFDKDWWETDLMENDEDREEHVITEHEGLELEGENVSEFQAESGYEEERKIEEESEYFEESDFEEEREPEAESSETVLQQLDELINDDAEQESMDSELEEMINDDVTEEEIVEYEGEESDPRKVEEDAAEAYLQELGFA